MNRIIFSRPNKTVRGNFQAKGVMKMLEQNRSTWLSMQDMVRDCLVVLCSLGRKKTLEG